MDQPPPHEDLIGEFCGLTGASPSEVSFHPVGTINSNIKLTPPKGRAVFGGKPMGLIERSY